MSEVVFFFICIDSLRPRRCVDFLVFALFKDHMWQHKQEERELKRTEGDILKKRYAVRHTLRDYENSRRSLTSPSHLYVLYVSVARQLSGWVLAPMI